VGGEGDESSLRNSIVGVELSVPYYFCTYHLKTLMLWTCEEMSPEWWDSSSVIKLCSNLLRKLVKCLQNAHFPNYFNPPANLFHKHFDLNIVDDIAKKTTSYCDSNILSL